MNEKNNLPKQCQEYFNVQIFLINPLVRDGKKTLIRQIYENIRQAILLRRLRIGTQLPSTRFLAKELKVSRNTVLNAFEQLIAEGYLVGKLGKGTFVAEELPDDLLQSRIEKMDSLTGNQERSERNISEKGKTLAQTEIIFASQPYRPKAFQTGLIAIDEFPIDIWTRTATRTLRKLPRKSLSYLEYGESQGYLPLRESIAKYLGVSRGVICEPSQIIIVSGSQQGLDIASRVLLDKGDEVLIEDPCYTGILGALRNTESNPIPVPIDEEGIDIRKGENNSGKARAVYVTPSHQFPTGMVMSLSRRLELLEWASRKSAWVIEDDYDSEFRYDGRPLAALQGLDGGNRVIYIGTFSKVLFPSLRLGYIVVPPDLVATFVKALLFTSLHAPVLEQIILTNFINQGHFGRHIRRMRKLYSKRQKILANTIKKELSDFIEVEKNSAGMHVIGRLKKGFNDVEIAERALKQNLYIAPLSFYCIKEKLPDGLILGYTGLNEREIVQSVCKLRDIFHQ